MPAIFDRYRLLHAGYILRITSTSKEPHPVSRPTSSVKSDNIFLVIYRALTLRRTPVVLRVVLHSFLLVGVSLALYAVGMAWQFRHAMHQHVDAIGHSLITQTAASATGLLAANDALSLHVLLSNLAQNPLVAYAGIQGADGRVLAEAGHRPRHSGTAGEVNGQYSMPLNIQNTAAGRLYVALDMAQFQQPLTVSEQNMGVFGLGILLVVLILSIRLGRQISVPIKQMSQWLDHPDRPFPTIHHDEIGGLLQRLRDRLDPEEEEIEELESDDEEPDPHTRPLRAQFDPEDPPLSAPAPRASGRVNIPEAASSPTAATPNATNKPENATRTAILALQFGTPEQLRQIPRARLQEFQGRLRELLNQIAKLYRAERFELNSGGLLLLFHDHSSDQSQSYLSHALCCGELLRSMSQNLQAELADTGFNLVLHMGLGQGKALSGLGLKELLNDEAVQTTLTLSQHSQNLLLLAHTISNEPLVRQRARVQPMAKPAGACCIERLNDPYPALLERQRVLLLTPR